MCKTGRTVAAELVELVITTREAGAKLVGMRRDDSVAVAANKSDFPVAVEKSVAADVAVLTAETAKVTPTAAHSCFPHAMNCCSPDSSQSFFTQLM